LPSELASPKNSLSAKYRSLVMITKDNESAAGDYEMANSSSSNSSNIHHSNTSNKGPTSSNSFGQNFAGDSFRALELVSSDRESYSVDSLNDAPAVPEISVEDGLADDDSWVEELSQRGEDEDEELATTTPTATDSEDAEGESDGGARRHGYLDREEELRGYNRSAIDFTLHTIVEESCEESEVASMRADNEDAELEDEDLASEGDSAPCSTTTA